MNDERLHDQKAQGNIGYLTTAGEKPLHFLNVIGSLPKETKVRIINDPELVGKCNAGQEDRILCITEYGGQEAYYLYKAIGIFLRSDLEVIDA